MGHLMCKAAQLRVRLNRTKGEEASGGDDNYQLSITRHEEKVAWETLGNKDAQLKVVMAEVNIRRNTGLEKAMGKAIISREVHKAWRKCQHIMSNLYDGMECIQKKAGIGYANRRQRKTSSSEMRTFERHA